MLKDGLNATATNGDRKIGDALKAIGEAAWKVDAVYSTPFLARACGHAVNPSQIVAQVEGSVVYGLSATLDGEMPVENGRMTSLNFDSYEIVRLAEMPKVETVIVPTYDFWGGVGEPTICVVAPAVLNAIFSTTGKPMRSLPLKNVKLA